MLLIQVILEEKKLDNNFRGERMLKLAKDLFPLNRSLMGPDIRKSFNRFIEIHPEFKYISFPTNKKVLDWEVPEEWTINDAYIEHESGKRFAEFKNNNLHLVGYSTAKNEIINKEKLVDNIHTIPEFPDAIPYITSYYKKTWGFCLTHNDFLNLPEGNYKVFIDSKHKKGELKLIEALLPGKSKKEIFFSSYLCHPSMANNELSGPVLLSEIMHYLKSIRNREYTYRFVLVPETIGSIAYLSKRLKLLQENMICGFNLTCVGDERAYTQVNSRLGNTIADDALNSVLLKFDNFKEYSYLYAGSDERQYCSPGINLPLCTFCRSKYGEYPEYHTSKDDFNVVTKKGLIDSFLVMKTIIDAFQVCLYPNLRVLGEPQLGKRNLYPSMTKWGYKFENPLEIRMNVIAYCDAEHNVFEISKKIKKILEDVVEELKILKREKLI